MSLICVKCGKIIVMSQNPDHLGVCAACGPGDLTDEQRERLEKSSLEFQGKLMRKADNFYKRKE